MNPRPTTTESSYRRRTGWDSVHYGTHCSNCLSTCSYRVFVGDGRIRWQEPAGHFGPPQEGVPDQNPMGCQKGAAWHRQIDSGDRLLHPMRRVGERGGGRWEQISWDEALTSVADAVLDAIEESGPETVLVDEGPEGGMLLIGAFLRFASLLGAVSIDGNATVNDFPAGHYITFGSMAGGSAAADTFHADLVLIWHANPAYTRIPYHHYLTEARYHGAEIVVIAPDFSPSAVCADWFVPIEPGTDAALGLSMCEVVVSEGLVDDEFVRSQTDLPLLVITETGRLLREADLVDGGREDRFHVWEPGQGPAPVDPDRLGGNPAAPLDGTYEVVLTDGSTAQVTPAFALLRRRLESYRAEDASRMCGVHPETIRALARRVAAGRTKLHEGFDTAKHYHGDLMERSMDLLLALTGNWGRQGRGFDTFCAFPFDGAYIGALKGRPGMEAADQVISAARAMMPPAVDGVPPALPRPGIWDMASLAALASGATPPAFFWFNHCGFGELWDQPDWGASPRPFREYLDEATPLWQPLIRPRADQPPRVLIEPGTNALRRTRGGGRTLLDKLWPQLSMVVSIDQRINTAGMYADILLPAAHEGERVNLQYPISHSLELVFTDRGIEPAGEARTDWQIFCDLTEAISRRAVERGIGDHRVGRMAPRPLAELGDAFHLSGQLRDDEAMVDELVRDTALSGVLEPDECLATLRDRGFATVIGNGSFPQGLFFGSAIDPEETFSGFRWNVEGGTAYPTLTGRATFYVDHPWFLEADEELPTHKPPPAVGGEHPFMLTGGHPRWSIHACNATNPLILQTTRGHPTLVMNRDQARGLGISDDSLVEVVNDLGSFRIAARLSSGVRPGQVILYAAWEPYGFTGWGDGTQVEAGMVKWLHLVTGWGHLRYSSMQWQPAPTDRTTRVDVRPA